MPPANKTVGRANQIYLLPVFCDLFTGLEDFINEKISNLKNCILIII